MTDRAAVMKCFGKKLEEFLKSELGEDVQLTFLYCNAHFLLGLSNACLTAFKEVESSIKEETNEAIGRDKSNQFFKFIGDSETSVKRLIRIACDILGPRGDQKNGYRVEWVEFCKGKSVIPCFKSNCFNCFFEASTAIIHQYKDIKNFLTSGVLSENVNLKVKSLAADFQDNKLLSCICSLVLLFLKVTGPYWKLINSSVPYSDFHKYVKELQLCFSQWSQDSSNLLSPDFFGPFGPSFSVFPALFQSVIDFLRGDVCDKSIVKHALQIVSSKCLIVLERQLCDFLTGSLSVIDKDKEEILKQCPLTNLVGESSFGDLDYDFNCRANCSMLNRSALHVIKRNKTASSYLACKTKEQRSKLFSVANKRSREVQKDLKTY